MDAIRYVVMGAWSKIKHWLPKDETPEEIDICDISSREVREKRMNIFNYFRKKESIR